MLLPNLKPFNVIASILCLLSSASYVTADEPSSYKFEEGQKLSVVIDLEEKQTLTLENKKDSPSKLTRKNKLEMLWTIGEVQDNGTASVEIKISWLQLKLSKPSRLLYEFDSKTEETPQTLGAFQVNPIMEAISDATLELQITSRGIIQNVTVPEKLSKLLGSIPQGILLKKFFSKEGFASMLQQNLIVFPEEKPKKDKEWIYTFKQKNLANPDFETTVTRTFKYEGPQEDSDKQLEKFSVTKKVELSLAKTGPKVTITSQNSKGSILFDNKSGQMVSSDVDSKVEMEVRVGQQLSSTVVEQKIKTTFQLVSLQKEASPKEKEPKE